MQLSVGWVCVLHLKLLIKINWSVKSTCNGQIAHDYKVPSHWCGRIWPGWQLREIMAFGASWRTSALHQGPLFSKFAADNTVTVGVWNLGWTFLGTSQFLQQMKCLFTASLIFTLLFIYFIKPTSHPDHKWNIIHEEEPTYEQMKHMGILWIWKLANYCPFCRASPRQTVRQEPG
jgi:hypothetical protein